MTDEPMNYAQAHGEWLNDIQTHYENHQLRLWMHIILSILTVGLWLIPWCFLMLQSFNETVMEEE